MNLSDLWEKALSSLTGEEQEALLVNVSEVLVCALPREFYITDTGGTNGLESFFRVQVKRRSEGRYAVIDRGGYVYDAGVNDTYEDIPSERSDSFKDEFRHDFLTALRIAEEVSLKRLTYGPDGPNVERIIANGGFPSRD